MSSTESSDHLIPAKATAPIPEWPVITVIIPVRNEERFLARGLASLKAMDYPADRYTVIIVDGMSTDRTAAIAREAGVRVIPNPRCNVRAGRNLGFAEAKGDLIAFTDGDCLFDREWLRRAVGYFRQPTTLDNGTPLSHEEVAGVGGPNITPPEDGPFAQAVGFVMAQSLFAAGGTQARNFKHPRLIRSIPGCNAIYRREAAAAVLPLDETALTSEDTEMNQRLLDLGWKLLYTPDVVVSHFRRPSPGRLYRQFHRYSISRLQIGRRDRRMINAMHVLVGFGLPLFALVLGASSLAALILHLQGWFSPVRLPLLLVAACAFGLGAVAVWAWAQLRDVRAALCAPLVVTVIFVAWSCGFLRELFFPVKTVE